MKDIIATLRLDLEAIENNQALYEEPNLSNRSAVLDFLEFEVMERIENLVLTSDRQEELLDLKQKAKLVKRQLEEVDSNLFQKLRNKIASRKYTGTELRELFLSYEAKQEGERDEGYDSLDLLVNGTLLRETPPQESREREPEMVFYQPTPARIVLELVEKAGFQPPDVFYDIGSGLGQVAVLVHLLGGVRAKGIEFEPAYCDYARRCAGDLNLSQVNFINIDAREADYSDGTVFFMYTPFGGRILEQVLERLRQESRNRELKLYTYGPCTLQVAQQNWLERLDQNGSRLYRLAIFKS